MDDASDSRQELYSRFRQSLKKPVGERFFDEEELIETFDYAGDLGDDYARFEILLCGARLYPESERLAERRAIFYSESHESALGDYVADNADRHTLLWDISRLRANMPEGESASGALDYLADQYDEFGDEEAIQFVKLAGDLDCFDWLRDNIDRLRGKVSYLPSLVYEIAIEAGEAGDFDTQIHLLEELIEAEPFSSTYWTLLFRAYLNAGRLDEARSAFDYAKALGADSEETLMYLVDVVCLEGKGLQAEALEIVQEIARSKPDDFRYADCMCNLYLEMGKPRKLIEVLLDFLQRNPGDASAMRQLLACNYSGADAYVEKFYEATENKGFGSDALTELASSLAGIGAVQSVYNLLSAEYRLRGSSMPTELLWSYGTSAYQLGKYKVCADIFSECGIQPEAVQEPVGSVPALSAFMISCMRCGMADTAKEFATRLVPVVEKVIIHSPMFARAMLESLLRIANTVINRDPADTMFWDYYDPLHTGKFA